MRYCAVVVIHLVCYQYYMCCHHWHVLACKDKDQATKRPADVHEWILCAVDDGYAVS